MQKRNFKKVLALILAGTMMLGGLPVADLRMNVQAEEAVEAFSVSFVDQYASVGKPLAPTMTGAQNATYKWYVGGVQKGTEETYTPTESDLNKWIEVQVTSGNETLSAKLYFSKLPVVYIDTEGGQAITSKENYIDADLRVQGNDQFNSSNVLYNGKTEIRGRGNSTWAQPKKPYRLKLDKKVYSAKVTSAQELSEEEKSNLIKKLSKVKGGRIEAEYLVDEKLIGGVIVEIEGTVMDGSLRRRLQQVKEVIK